VVVEVIDAQAWELHSSEIFRCDLIVDALFGTGLKTALSGLFETVVADINASPIPVVSIDLPSDCRQTPTSSSARRSMRR